MIVRMVGSLGLALVLAACAARAPRQLETAMPSPDGCFVQVWDAPQFRGAFDYLNGPRQYANLRDLPGGRLWNNRIRSVRVGPAANGTVYAQENFGGANLAMRREQSYGVLPPALSGAIASMTIDCLSAE